MRIFLEPNADGDCNTVPYLANVEITTTGVEEAYTKFRIPVHWYHLRDKSVYRVEVCGFQLDAPKPDEIPSGLEKLLPALVYMTRLPTYVFIARHSRYLYPVYTLGDEVIATTRGGPHFRHVELAQVREYLTDYLRSIGELWAPGNKDRLHVRGIHAESLSLVRPVFYLKKRVRYPQDNDFWAPVFPSDDGASIYTYAASARREEAINCGHEVLHLRSQVAQALMADKRLQEALDLRADRVMQPYWQRVAAILMPLSCKLVYNNIKLEIYQNQESLVAVEQRPDDENRVSLYFGRDAPDLQDRTAQDFVRRGLINDASALQLER
jgi:hypothetical protein